MKDTLTPEQLEKIAKSVSRCEVKVYITMDYNDLDNLITDMFAFPGETYECVCENEWCNDQNHDYRIDGKLDKWDEKAIEEMLGRKKFRNGASTRTILNYLCHHGIIVAGTYLIEVSW
jgi:hypothetical protein